MQQLGVGREAHRLRLHRGVDRDPLEVLGAQRTRLMREAQALGEQKGKLVAEPLAPVRQVRALMREGVLEELLPGEVLEIGVVDPALAHLFVRERKNVLEQQQPDHEAGLDPRPPLVAVERRDLAVEPVPVKPPTELNQLVLHIDDLVEPRPEQIARIRRRTRPRPHRFKPPPRLRRRNHDPRFAGIAATHFAGKPTRNPQKPAIANTCSRPISLRTQRIRNSSRATDYDREAYKRQPHRTVREPPQTVPPHRHPDTRKPPGLSSPCYASRLWIKTVNTA